MTGEADGLEKVGPLGRAGDESDDWSAVADVPLRDLMSKREFRSYRPTGTGSAVAGPVPRDAAMRLGLLLAGAGVGTAVVGVLSRWVPRLPGPLPWATAEAALGVTVGVVGYYLGEACDRLKENETASPRVNKRARWHRRTLALSLLLLAVCAVWTGVRFRPPGPATAAVTVTERGMLLGAGSASLACLVTFFMVTVFYRWRPATDKGRERRAQWCVLLTLASSRLAGLACLFYAATHAVASTFAPTAPIHVVLIATAAMLCLAVRECFRDVADYARILFVWSSPRLHGDRTSVAAAERAVHEQWARAEADPGYLRDLAASLHLLAVRQGELGLLSEALANAEDAVDIRRDLAATDAVHERDLAASLHLLAARLLDLGRLDEALYPAEEARLITRTLAQTDPLVAASRDLCSRLDNGLCRPAPGFIRFLIGRDVAAGLLVLEDCAS